MRDKLFELAIEVGIPKSILSSIRDLWRMHSQGNELVAIMKLLEIINAFLMRMSEEKREIAKQIVREYAERL